jgi:hypothetical protein
MSTTERAGRSRAPGASSSSRHDRSAAALRANLARRKQQARARAVDAETPADTDAKTDPKTDAKTAPKINKDPAPWA